MHICTLLDRVRVKYGCWTGETMVLALIVDSEIKMYLTAIHVCVCVCVCEWERERQRKRVCV